MTRAAIAELMGGLYDHDLVHGRWPTSRAYAAAQRQIDALWKRCFRVVALKADPQHRGGGLVLVSDRAIGEYARDIWVPVM